MDDETITFEVIREIHRKERGSPKLVQLPPNFFEAAFNYLKKKRELAKDRKDELEIRNAERLIKDIFTIREKKILNFALLYVVTNILPENLTEEEREFFEKLVVLLKSRRDAFFSEKPKEETEVQKIEEEVVQKKEEKMEEAKKEEIKEKVEEGYVKVKFKEEIPQFVGIDEKVYGPFSPGDIAVLPKENAELFVNAEMAEILS